MTLLEICLFFFVAAIGGGINAVAGGGTFLTFPVLILSGLSPLTANIMSTIALWPGSVSSVFAYRKKLTIDKKQLTQFMLISIFGSIIGTSILLLTPEARFSQLVPWLLLIATFIFTFGRRGIAFLNQFSSDISPARRAAGLLFQLLIAIYGGYFGAGIGILMLAMLQVMGLNDIHKMNALKTVLGSTINAVAVVMFVFSGKIIWPIAWIMICGAVVGGYAGAKFALRVSPEKVRAFVSFIGFTMTIYFFAGEMN